MLFRHYHRHPRFRGHATNGSYTAKQVAALYNYPAGATGKGTKVAVISLGGDFSQVDCDTYSKLLGVPASTVVVHLVAGATRVSDPGGADVENMLDLCCVGGSAPGAERHLVIAPNTDAGFAGAVQAAVDLNVDVISISWGAPEDQWSTSAIVAMNTAFANARAKGIVVTVAAGDNGSSDGDASGSHVDFPASSVYVVGCGGTSIKTASPLSEVVWNDGSAGGATGGGVSADFALPAFQANSGVPGGGKKRGVPDVGLNADPESGYLIIANGQQEVVGGTSGSAPMCAGLVACLLEKLGGMRFDFQAAVYKLQGSALRDITVGNNGIYVARSGYDCCTGNGVPVGDKLLASLIAPAPQPVPVPPPAPPPPTVNPPVTRTIILSSTAPIVVSVDGHTV